MSDALRDRIWSCVPVTGQAFGALLALLDVEESTAVPTACVTTGERSRMLVNPEFVADRCRTDDHLAMLVLHELYHVLLGHTRLHRRVTPVQNWAFDCLINAQLCRLFPHPRFTTFFAQFVPGDGGPADLLAPPTGWHADLSPEAQTRERARALAANRRFGEAHWRLYSDDSITTEELYRLLQTVGDDDGSLEDLTLLGNHEEGTSGSPDLHPEALREVREIVARWPMVERRSGRDQGGALREERTSLGERRRRALCVLRRALAHAAGGAGDGPARRVRQAYVDTLLPSDDGRDRRAAVQRALGHEPLLFSGSLAQRAPSPVERVRVYLDVSGSMEDVLPALYATLAACIEKVEPVVYGFSTEIGPISHEQLRRGVRLSTGGTEISTVTHHVLATGAKRALIVSDGWVGRIPAQHLRSLRRRRVHLAAVITADGDPAFARHAGLPVFQLPTLAA